MSPKAMHRRTEGRAGGCAARHKLREQGRASTAVTPGASGSTYRPLSNHDMERVHQIALNLLSEVGTANPLPILREHALAKGCTVDDAGRLHFPYGLGCDSVAFDGRSMIERSLLSLLTSLGGAGQLEVTKIISPLQQIIDDELIAIVRRLITPVAVDDDTMARGDLEAIAPGSHFLITDYTLRNCHDRLMPRAFARQSCDAWEEAGGHDLADRTRDIH